jgi:hypothetical protein
MSDALQFSGEACSLKAATRFWLEALLSARARPEPVPRARSLAAGRPAPPKASAVVGLRAGGPLEPTAERGVVAFGCRAWGR